MSNTTFGVFVDKCVHVGRTKVGEISAGKNHFLIYHDSGGAMVLKNQKTKAQFVMPWSHFLALAADSGFVDGFNAGQVFAAEWRES